MENLNELIKNLKEMKFNITKELDILSIEELEVLYRFFTLQSRINTIKEFSSLSNKDDPMQMMMDIFMNAKKANRDCATELHNKTIIEVWIEEMEAERKELMPKFNTIYAKLYASVNYQYVIDASNLIKEYLDKEKENK